MKRITKTSIIKNKEIFISWEEIEAYIEKVSKILSGKEVKFKAFFVAPTVRNDRHDNWWLDIIGGDTLDIIDLTLMHEAVDGPKDCIYIKNGIVTYFSKGYCENILRAGLGILLKNSRATESGVYFEDGEPIHPDLTEWLCEELGSTPQKDDKITNRFRGFEAGTPIGDIKRTIGSLKNVVWEEQIAPCRVFCLGADPEFRCKDCKTKAEAQEWVQMLLEAGNRADDIWVILPEAAEYTKRPGDYLGTKAI